MVGMSRHNKYGEKEIRVVDPSFFPVKLHEAYYGVPVEMHRFLTSDGQEYAGLYAGEYEVYKTPIEFSACPDKAELKMIKLWNDETWRYF